MPMAIVTTLNPILLPIPTRNVLLLIPVLVPPSRAEEEGGGGA